MDERRLESVPLFASLGKRARQFVARLAEDIDIPAGKELAAEGRFAHEFFVIQEGTAEVTQGGNQISTLGPGDFFGEIALLETDRRTATVAATSPMRLVVLSQASFASMRRDNPEVAEQIQAAIQERLAADAQR